MAPVKLAIIGAGPSSFYVASRLLSLLPPTSSQASMLKIHMYDRLWAPHGLVRYGVAPDHPEVKNCIHKFDAAAEDPRLRFFGNVNIDTPSTIPHAFSLPLSAILPHYTHLLISTGCTVPILHPSLPPSSHCVPALSLVHWYTAHPSNPPTPPLDKLKHVTLIGQGNVSLDVARMLLTPPSDLAKYDVPDHVLAVLEKSSIEHVSIVGRRGPHQAAFTTKELREMMNLPDASLLPLDPALLKAPPAGAEPLTRQQSRTLQLLQKGSKNKPGSTRKTWSLDFFRSPTGLVLPSGPSAADCSSEAQLTLAHTILDPSSHAVPTGETSTVSTSLVITSLGQRSDPSAAWYDPALGHIRTVDGHVIDSEGLTVRNAYASGWAATGARGVLASTMIDAYAVADVILRDVFPGEDIRTVAVDDINVGSIVTEEERRKEDMVEIMPRQVYSDAPPPEVEDAWRDGIVTDYEDWKAVSAEEVRRGQEKSKERERMIWEEAHHFLQAARPHRT
ncbi:FAD/NAD-P-binding domain-containing protein [Laetiporus sulphureus 93-53]|uniref:FAD/NAD-P-binding domain-containing protein n=1 Tax=Laetiporus sulphureus 93-53 TaxID=1314785 RepID=A0A165CN15_9APHY|nr:FAD/NAD-P-binding domain-containing protein [Laetiporus sulphureus 93-53]KZT03109.1 FAD/NAD-P-binding domain-containing protein [Laetiporus sulphureus 93-53]